MRNVKHYGKCFKDKTRRKDLEKFYIKLDSKKDLYLQQLESPYKLYTGTYGPILLLIGLLITKNFFKHTFNVFAYIFYRQRCFSLFTLYCSESTLNCHNDIRLRTTKGCI